MAKSKRKPARNRAPPCEPQLPAAAGETPPIAAAPPAATNEAPAFSLSALDALLESPLPQSPSRQVPQSPGDDETGRLGDGESGANDAAASAHAPPHAPSAPPPAPAPEAAGLRCPKCGCGHVPVVYKRDGRKNFRRRRECRHCGHRFTTREQLAPAEEISSANSPVQGSTVH